MKARRSRTIDSRVLSVIASYCAAGAFWGAFAVSLPAVRAGSGLGTRDFGLLLTALIVGAFPSMLLVSRHVHRLGRLAMPASLCLFAAGGLALSRGGSLPSLAASLVLLGAGSGALDISLNMRVSTLEDATGRSLFNIAHAAYPVALLVASAAGGAARDAGVDAGSLFVTLSLAMVGAAILELRRSRSGVVAPAKAEPAPRGRRFDRTLVLLGVAAALAAFAKMAVQSWAAIYVETVLATSATAAGLAFSLFTAGLVLGRAGAHALDARVPLRTLVTAAGALGFAAFGLLGASTGLGATMLFLLLGGVAVGPIEPAVFRTVAAGRVPESRGPALGLVTSIAYLGYLVSPPILGALAETAGWALLWWTVAAGFTALALVFRTASRNPTSTIR